MKSFIAQVIKGNRITIPKKIFEEMGIQEGSYVKAEIEEVKS